MKAKTSQFAQMTAGMRPIYLEFDRLMAEAGLDYIITSVARLKKEQIALYAQGRQSLTSTNQYRAAAGLYPIREAENSRIVTWTLDSDHVIDPDDGNPDNDYSRAFDIAIIRTLKGRKIAEWDLKVDVDLDGIPDYREAALIGRKVGLDPGFFWKKQDAPHYSWRKK